MGNIMSLKNVKNHPSRSGFDLSKRNLFTSKCGELLPIYCKELIPGDKLEIDVQHITRTAPVNTAAFTRIREYFDFFFVRTDLLWDKFGAFIAQTNDALQAASINTKAQLGDTHPYFTQEQIDNYLHYLPQTADNDKSIFGQRRSVLTCRLLELLGYGQYYDQPNDSFISHRENVALNPFPLLAYQKIYQDYFRNSQWEDSAPWCCNLNYINPSLSTASMQMDINDYTLSNSYNMFDLRYCNWNKDYFMGLLPNSQFGDAASCFVYGTGMYGSDSSHTGTPLSLLTSDDASVIETFKSLGVDTSIFNAYGYTIPYTAPISMLSILSLRQAEAYQKWREITQASQKDYKSQMEAHFGVKMSDAYSSRCKFIDGVVNNLDISEVTNTNLTEGSEARLAGKGVGTGQGKINFSTEVHGYIMCIYHAVPVMDYSITGIQRQNLKTLVTDYAIPEFDKTGMVQVPFVELCNTYLGQATLNEGQLLGYAPRYIDYKTDIDVINGNFRFGDEAWVTPFDNDYIVNFINNTVDTVRPYEDLNMNYIFFKVNPSILDPIFLVSADDKYSSDQFKTNAYFNVKATRNLDYNGLPY